MNSTNTAEFQRNVALDLVLTLLLCGLWNAVVQYSHCKALNALLGEEKYSFLKLCLFSLLTCGLYYIYHEYCKSMDYARISGSNDSSDPVLAVILALFGLSFIYDAILQSRLNDFLAKNNFPFTPPTSKLH